MVASKTTTTKRTKSDDNLLIAPKLMYALSSGGQSALVNFLPVFYDQLQYDKVQIGLLQTLPCICSMVAPPLWGAVADAIRNQRLVHIACVLSGAVLLYLIQFTRTFELTMLVVAVANFQGAPGGSLLDHAVLDLLAKVGGEYGKQRLFGAVGWGAMAYVSGLVVAVAGISWAFNLSLIVTLASLLVLRTIPPVRSGHHDDGYAVLEGEGASGSKPPSFREGLRLLAKKGDVLVLLVVVFLMGLMFGVLSSFLTLNLYNLSGNNSQIIGIAIACETASELPAFFFSQAIIRKLGTVNVLLVSIAGYAARLTYLAVMTNPWGAIPFEFLHGLTFGLAWAACTQYVYAAAPRGAEGTVMGILNAVQNGLGRGAGTLVGGYFYQNYGAPTMWLVTDLGVPLALAGVALFAYLKNADEAEAEDELLESAELFSPHHGDPVARKSPRNTPAAPSYDPIDG
ncbi:hypothetical protein PybrP1_001622 [[Pythium] brassicae (nom. inval.)]|nr:hypothetical protein PybrP1_001622 [[Pythium] brassicae (nom. inval.)]